MGGYLGGRLWNEVSWQGCMKSMAGCEIQRKKVRDAF